MDPVSALGLLASLSSLIKASNSLLDAVKGIKDAEKDFLELYNDLAIFDEALKGFDRVLRSRQTRHNLSRDVVYSAVEEASKTIQDLDSRLLQIAKTDVSAVRRLKCAQHKSSLKKSHDRLKEQSTMLQSFLALAHTFVTPDPTNTSFELMQSVVRPFLQFAASTRTSSSYIQM